MTGKQSEDRTLLQWSVHHSITTEKVHRLAYKHAPMSIAGLVVIWIIMMSGSITSLVLLESGSKHWASDLQIRVTSSPKCSFPGKCLRISMFYPSIAGHGGNRGAKIGRRCVGKLSFLCSLTVVIYRVWNSEASFRKARPVCEFTTSWKKTRWKN